MNQGHWARATLALVSREGVTRPHAWDDPTPGLRVVVLQHGVPGAPLGYALPDEGTITIGRDEACGIVIEDASVSREHAAIHVKDGVVSLEDRGSRNGTRVGDHSLAKGERVQLRLNELVELGGVVITVKGPGAPRSAIATPSNLGAAMANAYALADLVAPSPVSVLLLGETGVGKTAAAERIHGASGRKGPLLKLNCAAVPEALLEGELFGHERGAFTGAHAAKAGLVEAANGGTLLLDEIGDMSLGTQAKLLHVVEHNEVVRLGAHKPTPVDVRFLAATHRDLGAMVAAGTFRADLFYRINGITITIPALRERTEEILALAKHFLVATCARLGKAPPAILDDARDALLAYPWPGNLRELRNVMDRVALLAREGVVTGTLLGLPASRTPMAPLAPPHVPSAAPSLGNRVADTLPPPGILAAAPVPGSTPPDDPNAGGAKAGDLRTQMDSFEKEQIIRALEEAGGNQTRAAQIVGLPLRTFVKRLTHHGLTRPRKR